MEPVGAMQPGSETAGVYSVSISSCISPSAIFLLLSLSLSLPLSLSLSPSLSLSSPISITTAAKTEVPQDVRRAAAAVADSAARQALTPRPLAFALPLLRSASLIQMN